MRGTCGAEGGRARHAIPQACAPGGANAPRCSRTWSKTPVIGMPGGGPARQRQHSHPVSAGISGRCWPVKSAGVLACQAASPCTRWRSDGAGPNRRATPHLIAPQGATPTWAAARQQTARGPACAAAPHGATAAVDRPRGRPRPLGPGARPLGVGASRAGSTSAAPASAGASSRSRLRS
jgi:hypothetical protein